MKYCLEICVDNLQSARNAENGGADRLELCQALEVGGLTPSVGFIRKVKEIVDIPVFVMIRARSGNFEYDVTEVEQMEIDIETAISVGANGFVFGSLRNHKVDKEICSRLLRKCPDLPATFHRAFDLVKQPFEAINDIIDLGFMRVLTSGQAPTVYQGLETIRNLVQKVDSKIIIMPGCGISEKNLDEIKSVTTASEYHASAQYRHANSVTEEIVIGTTFHSLTSCDVVKNMKRILNS